MWLTIKPKLDIDLEALTSIWPKMTPGSIICKKIQYEFKSRRTKRRLHNVSAAHAIDHTKKLQKKRRSNKNPRSLQSRKRLNRSRVLDWFSNENRSETQTDAVWILPTVKISKYWKVNINSYLHKFVFNWFAQSS